MKETKDAVRPADPYLWLEEIEGRRALDWVTRQNEATVGELSRLPDYERFYRGCLEVFDSAERIAHPAIRGDFIYNFWKDKDHQRGLWRRAPRAGYLKGDPAWETLVDCDALSRQEGVNWDFHGAAGLFPSYDRFLVNLSRGGGDATVIREYDTARRAFVDEGFSLPESKGDAAYLDRDTLLVARDFGPGTLTNSGYPRQVRLWRRGTAIADAPLVLEGAVTDVSVSAHLYHTARRSYAVITQGRTFYSHAYYGYERGALVRLAIPDDAYIADFVQGQAIIVLRSDWKIGGRTFRRGSVVSADYAALLQGTPKLALVLRPDDRSSVDAVLATKGTLLVAILRDVKSVLLRCRFRGGRWAGARVPTPPHGTVELCTADPCSDDYFFYYEDFLTPSALYFARGAGRPALVRSMPSFFDGRGLKVWQYRARSKDGTRVPYFVVGPAAMKRDGRSPALLYAYGGFEVAQLPIYGAALGRSWLERGGVYVLANIRGGGEFGPRWHQAGLKEKRQNVYDDFFAVAQDLATRKITSARHLGIKGGSNGGLLMGVALTQRPELYRAVVCGAPLLDMRRFNKLLAGASWMAE
ncbi:MAG TPA: prolyl oligopeptidase family serine peptidase, partial [Candidatus Edwardsbacteria bacterium]|nr:prolyl oligopeptidase family serine peptidase [Candidatus Edwardsbacteria bacterium]